jgi:hypothetical protein
MWSHGPDGSKPMYAEIERPVASLASRPSDAAWNMPRHLSSGIRPARPGSNEVVGPAPAAADESSPAGAAERSGSVTRSERVAS